MLRTIPIAHEPVGPDEHLRPVPGRPGMTVDVSHVGDAPFVPDVISVKGYALTADMIATLGMGKFIVSGQTNWSYFLYDFVATQSLVTPDPKDPHDATVRGVGLRIAIAAQSLSATASLSLGSVAASATIHSVTTKLKVVPVGFESAGMDFVTALSTEEVWDLRTLRMLGQATGELIDYLANPPSPLSGVAIAVVINEAPVESAATSFGFALRAVQYGKTQDYAESAPPTSALPGGVEISDAVIALVYHNVAEVDNPNKSPSEAAQTLANSLTHTGP